MSTLPAGTVTLLFTDIEGSTRLLQQLGDRYASVLAMHHHLLRTAISIHDGVEVSTEGDAFFVVFARATDAVAAAIEAQRALVAQPWPDGIHVRVRMGLHTGEPRLQPTDYVGLDVHRAARIAAAGHGGQVLLSHATTSLVGLQLPNGVTLRDLGAHRLKDLPAPEHLSQIVVAGLPADFPPIRSLDTRPNNLPIPPTPLIGRTEVLAQAMALLQREDVRLVTLTGAGGAGKTRLGLAVAAEVLHAFADGVFLVSLAPLTDPEPAAVGAAIGRVLGVREETPLLEYLRGREVLLVLDNFEHLLPAAPLVAALLAACPRLRVLVTSRAPLRLSGEHEWAVPPLAVPPDTGGDGVGMGMARDALMEYAAVQLFVARATAARVDFTLTSEHAGAVAALCRRLDGLPLALELAAARVRALPPAVILTQLEGGLGLLSGGPRDLPTRQQALNDTIRWSYDLLTPDEQRLFRRLSVFVGGCTLDAVDAVCAEGTVGDASLEVLDGLLALVDHSLLQQQTGPAGEPRFVLLETVRSFSLEQLAASGEGEMLRTRHAAYFHALALKAEERLFSREFGRWIQVCSADQDNLRAVIRWATIDGDVQFGLDTAAALLVWFMSVALQEGRRWLEQLLALPAAAAPTRARARALRALGWLIFAQSDLAAARTVLKESIALWRTLDDPSELAMTLGIFAVSSLDIPDQTAAIAAAEEALTLAREVNDPVAAHFAVINLGNLALIRRDIPAARAAYEQSADFARETGSQQLLAGSMGNLARAAAAAGDDAGAVARFTEALTLLRSVDTQAQQGWLIAGQLWALGEVISRRRDPEPAAAVFREALELSYRIGSLRDAVEAVDGLGRVAFLREEWKRGTCLLGAAEGLRAAYRITRQSASLGGLRRAHREEVIARTRAALGEQAFTAAWAAGGALSLEEAVTFALEEGRAV